PAADCTDHDARASSPGLMVRAIGDLAVMLVATFKKEWSPIAPTMIQGPATEGSSAVRTCAHTHAAGRTTKNNRNAVRFTVPSTVIAGAVGSRRTSANVFAFRAGFDVRIKAMAPRSLECGPSI